MPLTAVTLADLRSLGANVGPTVAAKRVLDRVNAAIAAINASPTPLTYRGVIACAGNPNYPAAAVGDVYIVSTAGLIGGGAGIAVDSGDMLICQVAGIAGTQAAVGANWARIEHNLVGALLAANNLSDLANAGTARTNLGLAIGTNVQAFDADLSAIAALVSAADQLPYATGAQTWAVTTLTTYARTLLDDVDATAARATLGLGTAATTAATDYATAAQGTKADAALPSASLLTTQVTVASGATSVSAAKPAAFVNDKPCFATIVSGTAGAALSTAVAVSAVICTGGNLSVALTGNPGVNNAIINVWQDIR